MSKHRWTIVVIPQGSSTSKVLEVSHSVLKLVASFGIAAVLLSLLLGYGTIRKSVDLARIERLQRENQVLAGELGSLHGRVNTLTDTISALENRDTKIRLLANLEPIDPDVHAAGIGGPKPANVSEPRSAVFERATEIRIDVNALIRRANLLASSFREAAESLAVHTERLATTPSIIPTQGWLTSAFSSMREHPILHELRPHEGIDVTAPMGAPIEAPAKGLVTLARWENGYGNMVVIDHGNGITTKFAHASRILVQVGSRVKRGDRIALIGNTGLATGPHLHYEVHVNGRPVNPLKYVLPGVVTD